jgi:predicted dinucleotide-binding enzyme
MRIAIIGTGIVGRTIASKLVELNHDVMIGTRNVADKLASIEPDAHGNPPLGEWLKANSKIKLGSAEHLILKLSGNKSFKIE